ncbi:MAG TPA: acyl-CoA dehydrogenase family protein [Acidimicrobiales bacterium]|nr:acyl-CoA dehydrogenase family protein [Acidimicrobiales bacterium]
MDFTLTEEQQAIADLADTIVGEQCTPEVLRAVESGPDDLAANAWKAVAVADLLGLALPESFGGSGLGLVEAALVAQKVGRHVAPVPYWTSTAAALAVARWGDESQQARWLPGVANGSAPLAVAPWHPVDSGEIGARPVAGEGDWALHGTATPVPWAGQAAALVVPAQTDSGPGLFLVDLAAAGVTRVDEQAINHEPAQTVTFDRTAATRLGSDGDDAVEWSTLRTRALLGATMLGVCEGALALTATYVTERKQFGSPIGTFQAVAHRCADAYVDTEAIRLTNLQALWRLQADHPEADDAVAVATFWATDGGHRVVHAAQHLHGGIGMDVDYPIHRYFRWEKVLEALLGGPRVALASLGTSIARPAPTS